MEQNQNEIENALLYNMQLIAEYSNDIMNDMNELTFEIQTLL